MIDSKVTIMKRAGLQMNGFCLVAELLGGGLPVGLPCLVYVMVFV